MKLIDITDSQKKDFNQLAAHPLQSYEWGEFRKKTGVTVIRKGITENGKLIASLQYTIHPLPFIKHAIGYLPKYGFLSKELLRELATEKENQQCILLQHEPLIAIATYKNTQGTLGEKILHKSPEQTIINHLSSAVHPLFTKYTFILDLTQSEDELLKNMHSKTRYNIRVAEKKVVTISEDNSESAFAEYLSLTKQTSTRQQFFAHNETYHKQQWETFSHTFDPKTPNRLTSHLFLAKYEGKTLAAWILFTFNHALYYPYGASSSENREVMASNVMMWEVIRFGKKLGLKQFDMWGSMGPTPDTKDPWYGFHRFKLGYGAELIEYAGSFDQVLNPFLYQGYKLADKVRWFLLGLKK
ncbi:peptidoglycan bridge formation glycyltransferase FemA/FemB family protein [soil metagenome]